MNATMSTRTASPVQEFSDNTCLQAASISVITEQGYQAPMAGTLISSIAWMLEKPVTIAQAAQVFPHSVTRLYRFEDGTLEVRVQEQIRGHGFALRGREVNTPPSRRRPNDTNVSP